MSSLFSPTVMSQLPDKAIAVCGASFMSEEFTALM